METKIVWNGNMKFTGTTPSNFSIIMDASPDHGGENQGPRPMELILVALGGCTGMDVISILQKMKEKVETFEIKISAERAEEHPKVYRKVHLEYIFKGENLKEENIKKAIELSQTKYCSVSAILRGTAEVTYSWKIL
ncbi:MAG: OsmC family protein [Dictyoglomus sp.]|nr:OsmC family protein [Dictyoglomus sp.]MCX7941528.1 OsmC family protein [Dictyoglomaceae bacterium]MDW8187852.1 OsmC family protein [Dictyoglomus sp.]